METSDKKPDGPVRWIQKRLRPGSRREKESDPNTYRRPKEPQTQFAPKPEGTKYNLSSSVDRMMKDLSGEEVYSYQLVEYLLEGHSWYAKSSKRPSLDKKLLSEGEKKLVSKWIDEVSSLYNVDKMRGKLVILGLALLDKNLRKELNKNRFIYALKDDYTETSFESMLNGNGKKLWGAYFGKHDTVRTLADDPAGEADVDILGRKTFARGLVERMVQISEEENHDGKKPSKKGSFLIHIHGPWGSGKSSLLNFMCHELEEEIWKEKKEKSIVVNFYRHDLEEVIDKERKNKWIVVNFNAWQHQRTGPPPWWSLMDAVFKRGVSRLRKISLWRCIVIILWEYLWRLWKGTSPVLWGLTIILIFIGFGIGFGFFNFNWLINPGKPNPNNIVIASLALIVSLLTGLRAISTSLVPGSARAAEQFVEMKGDPMEQISRHFERLVHMIEQPVAIFVDDLDRCNDSYTVEFLERIQTLFRQAGVFYVIAADRRWLFSSYKKAYDSFKNDIDEPGRPLSHLFLAKTFQLSVPLPRLSPELQREYWEYLLQTDQYDMKEKLEAAKERVQGDFEGRSDEDILAKTEEKTNDLVLDRARKEVAVIELAKKERIPVTEQFLKPYAKFLEPNPRAMKRLVNQYSLARDIRILEGSKIEREKLALWTIITMRWPLLGEYLEEDCERVKPVIGVKPIIGEEKLDGPGISEDIKKLLIDKDVISVIKGEEVGGPLDEHAIRYLTAYEPGRSAS